MVFSGGLSRWNDLHAELPGPLGEVAQHALAVSLQQLERWNVAPDRVRRLDHSLKRDTAMRANNPRDGSPLSMTQPMTTLTCGQCAIAASVFPGSTFHRATMPRGTPGVSSERCAARADRLLR